MTNRIATRATNRISARTTNLLAVAAIAGSALLGLTACGSDAKPSAAGSGAGTPTTTVPAPAVGAPNTNGTSASAGATQASPGQDQPHPTTGAPAAPKSTPKNPAPSAPTTPKKSQSGSGLPVDCTTTQLKATVTNLTRPINHILLTVTNTAKAPCNLYYYPDLRFDADQQSVTQAVEDSKPQAVVTIAPGESAYAAIGTSAADGSGGNGKVQKQVDVFLETRNQSGSLPGSLTLPLPANTYVDDKAFVTYWQSDLQDAIVW